MTKLESKDEKEVKDDKEVKDEKDEKEVKEDKDVKEVCVESIQMKQKTRNCCVSCIKCTWKTLLNCIEGLIECTIVCCTCTKACLERIDCDDDDE